MHPLATHALVKDHCRPISGDRQLQRTNRRPRYDRTGIYRLEYRLPACVLASVMNDPGNFRALPDGRFDVMPWFQNAGVVPNERSSFVIDSRESTLTAIDNGQNFALSENVLRPLHPLGYERISP